MSEKQLVVGVIGLGRIGQLHAEALAQRIPRAQVVAVAEPLSDVAQSTGEQLQVTSVYTDAESLLDVATRLNFPDSYLDQIRQARCKSFR